MSAEVQAPEKPLSGLDAVKAAIAADASKLIKDSAVKELKAAVETVRNLASADAADPDAMKAAKVRVAAALGEATKAGVPQEELIAASQLPAGEERVKGEEEKPVKKQSVRKVRKLAAKGAKAAAKEAKAAAKTAGEIVKAAAQAAKAAGGDGQDIIFATEIGKKVAGLVPVPEGAEEESSSSSSSSDSDSSEEAEQEEAISKAEAAKALREGIAAAFYFDAKK